MLLLLPAFSHQAGTLDYEFVYHADQRLNRVNVAGSFQGWNKDSDPMTVGPDGLTWIKHFALKPGKYTYKFVLNGDKWITDPKAVRNESDGNGNTNSVLMITPAGYEKPAAKGDGAITASALQHLTEVPFLNYDRGHLTLSLRTRPNDIRSVGVEVDGKGLLPMSDVGGDDSSERYSVNVRWDRKSDVRYRFVLDDGAGAMDFGPNGLTSPDPNNSFVVKAASFKPFVVPNWVEHSVIYQIFPDRFARADADAILGQSQAHAPTLGKSGLRPVADWESKPTLGNYLGGNIAGIEHHLDYLKSLGVSCVFFNPVFKSPVYHRYETADYLKIDPVFGTNDQFAKLTRDLKADGIRTILDGVFNHTATSFAPFADVVKNGADSRFTQWYTFRSFPVRVGRNPNYVAWFNYPSMPKVNYTNPDTRKYMLDVPKYWQTHAEIAGWRLDAANEVVPDYWQDFRKTVKSIDPNTWIVGEVWGDGSPWLKGDQWDSVMNYQFREAVTGFVSPEGTHKPSDLMRKLMNVYNSYAPQVSRNMMNLIGSHDTARILNVCGGDPQLAKLAAIIQFTWVGAPNVYYGDEIGMAGDRDPDNRRGMRWDLANSSNGFLNFYKALIRTRNENLPLQEGDPVPVLVDDSKQVASYARVLDGKADIVAVNRADQTEEVDLNVGAIAGLPKTIATVEFTDALTGREYDPTESTLHLRLSPKSAVVLVPRSGHVIHSRRNGRSPLVASRAMSKALIYKELQ